MEALVEPELDAPSWKGAVTLPAMLKVCGEFGASSVRVMVAERCPSACGANETLMAQVAWTASGAAVQLLVCVKSPGFAPPRATPPTRSAAVPELVITMVFAGPLPP